MMHRIGDRAKNSHSHSNSATNRPIDHVHLSEMSETFHHRKHSVHDDDSPEYRQRLTHAAKAFFQKADQDGGGSISPLEFARCLKKQGKVFAKGNKTKKRGHARGKSWFDAPMGLYAQIDDDGSGEIDEDEFVDFVLSDKCNLMLKQLLLGTDESLVLPPPPAPPLAPLPEFMENNTGTNFFYPEHDDEEEKQRRAEEARRKAAEAAAARETSERLAREQAAREQLAREKVKREQDELDRVAREKAAHTAANAVKGRGGFKKGAKRRATGAFMADPTMKATTEDVTGTLEGVELQMLRGIFAAHDENKDGIINKSQLAEALVSLGFSPSEKLMTKFYLENASRGKKNWKIDLECFLSAAGKWLDSAEDCASDVIYLFEQFDKTKSRDVRWVVCCGVVWLFSIVCYCVCVYRSYTFM